MIHYRISEVGPLTACGLNIFRIASTNQWLFLVNCPKCVEYIRTPVNKLPPQDNELTVDKGPGQKIK